MIEAIQRRLAARENGEQGGFTLIELMVVVMIIAILIGIAIPAFLGARKRAQDTAAKSNLRNALSSATADLLRQPGVPRPRPRWSPTLADEEPSLKFTRRRRRHRTPRTAKNISVAVDATVGTATDDDHPGLAVEAGNCFFIRHVNTAWRPTCPATMSTPGRRRGDSALRCRRPDGLAAGWTAL